jgi:Mrp family chromosome partitioning ATPase
LPPDDASPEALPPAPLPHDEPPATEERPAAAASAPRPLTIKTVDTPRNPASPPRVAAVSPAAMAVRAGDSSHRRSQSKRLRKKAKPGKKSKSPKDKPATPAAARKPRQPQRSRAGQRPASPPRRRNWRAVAIFVVTFVLVAAPAAAAVWLAYAPPFKASAMLRVVVLPSHLARAQPNEAQRRVVIKLEQWLLDSPTVLTRVLENPLVRRSAWFSPPAAPWPQSLLVHDPKPEDRLRTGLDLIIGPQSETVELSLRSAQGEDLSQVLDCVIAAYRAAAAERLDPQVESAYQKRYERFGELQRAILDQQDVVSALAADLDGADSETYLATCKLRLDQTQDQLSTVVRDLAVDLFQRGDVPARDGGAVSKLQERQKRLQEELSARQAQWEKASRLNSACTAARRELAQKQQDLDQVRAELNDLAMKRAVVAGDLEPIAAGPTGPAVRLADQRPWLLILVAALALAAGRVAIWLLGGSGAVAARAIEVAWPGQTRILAVLPDLAGARDKAPFDATAALRAALRAQRGPSHNALVQLTASTDPQAKSALATALARHLARQERVLLVDADMHEGSIAERLGLHVRWGLADILAARCTDAEAIIQAGDLHILPAGKLHAGAAIADLLAGPAMAQCLARWRAAWDLVLLDSPPVLGLSDAGILSHLVDRTLLVVSRGGCRLRDVRQALGHLRPGADGCVEVVFIGGGSSAKSKV